MSLYDSVCVSIKKEEYREANGEVKTFQPFNEFINHSHLLPLEIHRQEHFIDIHRGCRWERGGRFGRLHGFNFPNKGDYSVYILGGKVQGLFFLHLYL